MQRIPSTPGTIDYMPQGLGPYGGYAPLPSGDPTHPNQLDPTQSYWDPTQGVEQLSRPRQQTSAYQPPKAPSFSDSYSQWKQNQPPTF